MIASRKINNASRTRVTKPRVHLLREDPEALLSSICQQFIEQKGAFILFKRPLSDEIEGFFGGPTDWSPTSFEQLHKLFGVFFVHPFEHTEAGGYALNPSLRVTLQGSRLSYSCRRGETKKWKSFFSSALREPLGFSDEMYGALPLNSSLSQKEYISLVEKALSSITQHRLQKVVLSRYKVVSYYKQPIRVFTQLCELYAASFTYFLCAPGLGIWLGASPELLLRHKNNELHSMALASTHPVPTSGSMYELKWTEKEKKEQGFVKEYIEARFKEINHIELQSSHTETVRAGDLLHLCTFFKAQIPSDEHFSSHQLLSSLHPTPALCGYPTSEALSFIQAHEPSPRGFYGGLLGPIYAPMDYQLYVNIRSARLYQQKAHLYAGGGIVAGSNPYKEWLETELKCQTIERLLRV